MDGKWEVVIFESRAEYLVWRAQWRKRYRELTRRIRELKNARKQVLCSYKRLGTARIRTGKEKNPAFRESAAFECWPLRVEASRMCQVRGEMRLAYNARKKGDGSWGK